MNIWCHAMKKHCPETITDFGLFYPDMNKFYSLNFVKRVDVDILEQNLYIDTNQGVTNDLAGWICQDYLSFIYSLHEVYGELSWTFHCDPELDKKNFGAFLARNYWCDVTATVTSNGDYNLEIYHKLEHKNPAGEKLGVTLELSGEVDYEAERQRQDMSFEQSVVLVGNFKNWISDTIQVEESVHPQYRRNTWTFKN